MLCSLAKDHNSFIFIFSILYTCNKMNNLKPITHKEFDEFIKGKGFKGRNNYTLKELKAMFGFKLIVLGSPITISRAGEEPIKFDFISKASTSTGIPYSTLLYAKRES